MGVISSSPPTAAAVDSVSTSPISMGALLGASRPAASPPALLPGLLVLGSPAVFSTPTRPTQPSEVDHDVEVPVDASVDHAAGARSGVGRLRKEDTGTRACSGRRSNAAAHAAPGSDPGADRSTHDD